MPLMEYTCEACSTDFETLVMGAEKPVCPKCRSARLNRRWSLPARPSKSATGPSADCPTEGPPCNPHCCRLPQG